MRDIDIDTNYIPRDAPELDYRQMIVSPYRCCVAETFGCETSKRNFIFTSSHGWELGKGCGSNQLIHDSINQFEGIFNFHRIHNV